jgi:hypothetical protein
MWNERHHTRGRVPICALVLALLLALGAAVRGGEPTVVLGLASADAEKYNVEFMRFDRTLPLYKEHGIQASLLEFDGLFLQDWPEEKLYGLFRQYHVVAFYTSSEGCYRR